jgi:hypothetical protein
MKLKAKKHYTFIELAARWECDVDDLVQAVIDQELVPSIHISGAYCSHLFTVDQTLEAGLQIEKTSEGDSSAITGRTGFHFLIWPRRTGISDCQFCFFSDKATGHDEGDICFELTDPIDMADVLKMGIFLPEEIARIEAISDDSTANEVTQESAPLKNRERDTLLTIIAALAKYGKISIDEYGKSAGFISGLTDEIGASVAKRTIEEHLKKIPNALEVRMK